MEIQKYVFSMIVRLPGGKIVDMHQETVEARIYIEATSKAVMQALGNYPDAEDVSDPVLMPSDSEAEENFLDAKVS